MYCNKKILQHIQKEEYKEGMPKWMYECKDIGDKCFDVGPALCTSVEVDDNLDNDVDTLHQASDRVQNDGILEQENEAEDEITL